MRIIRYQKDGSIHFGALSDGNVTRLTGEIGEFTKTDDVFPLSDARLLAPVAPPNIIAIGLNYGRHALESAMKLPDHPLIFIKASTSLAADGDGIVLPACAPDEVDYEGELAIVIGKACKNASEDDALDYVLGYTCANDVSARDCQLKQDTQWARGKSFDTFCPLGPWIETELDAGDLAIETKLNGNVMQSSRTSDLIFGVKKLVSFCSRDITLLPGTVILTGTPDGVGFARKPPVFLKRGDVVEITIEGIGTLKNGVE